MRIRIIFLGTILCLFVLKGFSWGAEGHRITASIAYHLLSSNIRDSVQFYLGNKTIQDASNWMDEVRSNHDYDVLKPLHYINMEKGETYKPKNGNIISELKKTIDELTNRKALSKGVAAIDLKILLHLLGDLHQPLHVGYGSDRGGNNIDVDYLHAESNLHKVWDTEIIRTKNITTDSCLKVLAQFDTKQIERIQTGDVVSWMHESRSFLDSLYHFENKKITQEYIDSKGEIVKRQLVASGVRMAKVLQGIFEK